MGELVLVTRSAAETEHVAEHLGRCLQAGDRVLLRGDLGGGKTTFTRGLVRGAGHPDDREVASPTFALHHRYEGGPLPVDHLDLYRLEGGEDLRRQGILDPLQDPAAVTVIEWAERLPPGAVDPVLEVDFQVLGPDARRLSLRVGSHAGPALVEGMQALAAGTFAHGDGRP